MNSTFLTKMLVCLVVCSVATIAVASAQSTVGQQEGGTEVSTYDVQKMKLTQKEAQSPEEAYEAEKLQKLQTIDAESNKYRLIATPVNRQAVDRRTQLLQLRQKAIENGWPTEKYDRALEQLSENQTN